MRVLNMHRVLTFSLVFIAACGPAPVVESQYVEYLARFNREATNRGLASDTRSISVTSVDSFDSTLVNVVGLCMPGTGEIQILKSYWARATDSTHESLLFHELGHCALNYGHTNNYPAIMYPYVMTDSVYVSNRSILLDKFFNNNF